MALPCLCCVSAWLSVQAETLDLGLVAVPSPTPTTSSVLCTVCWHLCFNLPALPTSLSGMSKQQGPAELPVEELYTA